MINRIKEMFPDRNCCMEIGKTTAKENRRTFRLKCDDKTKKSVVRVRIDNCLICDSSIKKCDWLFIIPKDRGFVFVECKGTNVLEAIEQIRVTREVMASIITKSSSKRYAVVVPTNQAPITSSQIQREKKIFKRDYGITLHIKSVQCVLTIPSYRFS